MISSSFHPYIGGGEQQAFELSKQLVCRGWDVKIVTRRHNPHYASKPPKEDVIDGVTICRVSSPGSGKIGSYAFLLAGLLMLMTYGTKGIFHAHGTGVPAAIAVLAAIALDGKSIIKLRSGRQVYENKLSGIISRCQFRGLLKFADRIIVVNSELQDLLNKIGVPRNKVIYIPNFVDLDHFRHATAAEKNTVRTRLNLKQASTNFLYVGRLERIKGVDILIKAYAKLSQGQKAVSQLLIVGDGNERSTLEQLAYSLNVNAIFTGTKHNPRDWYWASDFFLLPSHSEGLSNALLEAMACRLPVCASSTGGSLDVIKEYKNGLLYSPNNVDELSSKLEEILSSKQKWGSWGEAARETVSAYANIEITSKRYADLYQQLMKS
jgi:glycosyltransferase involved in cell wall biosynthesis